MAQSERLARREELPSPQTERLMVFAREAEWRRRQRPLRPELADEEYEGLQRLTLALQRLQS